VAAHRLPWRAFRPSPAQPGRTSLSEQHPWCITQTDKCYTRGVPTTRPRHFVTETDDVADALDRAAERWPGLSRSQLLVRLALEADHAAMHAGEARRQRRRTAIAELSGSLTGVYEPGYLDALRQDWPE